jgi:hypothetical protein
MTAIIQCNISFYIKMNKWGKTNKDMILACINKRKRKRLQNFKEIKGKNDLF